MTGRVLLDATTSLTWSVAGELDDMEGVEDAGCVLELAKRWRSYCLPPWRGLASRSGYRSETVRRARPASSHARCQTLPGQGLTSGPWGGPSREWSTMPVSSRGPSASVLVMPHVLVDSQHPHACETGGVIRCGLGEAA